MNSEKLELLAYSVGKAAYLTDYSTRAIRKAIQDGDLPAYRHVRNGTRRVFRDDLVAWIKGLPPPSLNHALPSDIPMKSDWVDSQ